MASPVAGEPRRRRRDARDILVSGSRVKGCPTCNKEWPADHHICPHDGTRLDSGDTGNDDTLAIQSSPGGVIGTSAMTRKSGRGSPQAVQVVGVQDDEQLQPGQMVSEYKVERCIG